MTMILLNSFYSARGGIDYERYIDVTNQFDISLYYLSNIVSWTIIYSARLISDNVTGISLLITYLLYLINISFERQRYNSKTFFYLFFALISPVGVLLSLNVLRQYIAIFFLFLAFYFWCKSKNYRAYALLIMSLLSHQISFIFAPVFLLSRVCNIPIAFCTIIGCTILINSYSVEFFTLGESAEKLYFYNLYSAFLLSVHLVSSRLLNYEMLYNNVELEKYLCTMFFTLLVFSYLTSLPVWALNRLWIGYSFLLLLIIFSTKVKNFGKFWLLKIFLLASNLIALSFHNGAKNML